MKSIHRQASRAKHNPPSFDISMLNYVAPTVPHSLFLKTGPAPSKITTKAAWDTKVLDGLQDPNEDHIIAILVKIKAAFELLKTGHGESDDYERLACAFNVALIRAEAIDPLAEQTMLAGIEAMKRCDGIWQRHGRYGFTGPDLIAVADAIELYEGILRLSAPVLMEAAATEAARRAKAKKTEPVKIEPPKPVTHSWEMLGLEWSGRKVYDPYSMQNRHGGSNASY